MKQLLITLLCSLSLFASEALVSPQWLHDNLNKEDLRIVEVSDQASFKKQHISGAVPTSINKWRLNNGTFLTIRSIKEIQQEIQNLGITKDTHVVLYASVKTPKDYLKATYIYWAMNYVGLTNISLLDGGENNWSAQGYDLTDKVEKVQKSNFQATVNHSKIADITYVKQHLGKIPMIDARPSDKYLGITPTATVKRNGHIQGAMSYSWNYSVNKDYTLKSQKALDRLFKEGYKLDKNKEVLVYCTGGLETSYNYFLLSGVLGYKQVRLYDASMKQWGNQEDTPMNQYMYEVFK
ncbi:sulfurtransferase [Sulfurimonas marina]|uniref:Sulfurtransferase n=1 Tax=Sulfurimonas marina TaxID=2590551 RepID=A0A7M1AUV2_9BACT|nr:rhodanese-like domain-containing protein [Sulfurimonas marina]QOP41205.1 sulfurtransferase [Sulfurimonas marina]